jgi:hypothetical protein
MSYRSDDRRTALTLRFEDIREADVSVPGRIRIVTYDVLKRDLKFHLRQGIQDEALGRFLAEHLQRPVIAAYGVTQQNAYRIPAYHRGVVSGSHGTLVIGSAGIEFTSKRAKDSRTWLYRDIQTIGTSDPFHFRVTTYAETFTFDLKQRLPDEAYRLASDKVYGLEPVSGLPAEHGDQTNASFASTSPKYFN